MKHFMLYCNSLYHNLLDCWDITVSKRYVSYMGAVNVGVCMCVCLGCVLWAHLMFDVCIPYACHIYTVISYDPTTKLTFVP